MTGSLPQSIEAWLRARGHDVARYGALVSGAPPEAHAWTSVGGAVGEAVARGAADYGVLCCWTGTGVSIAANKVPGVRAALCADPQTAAGAREWNDANVLCLSLRSRFRADGRGDTRGLVWGGADVAARVPRDDRRAAGTVGNPRRPWARYAGESLFFARIRERLSLKS